MSHPFDATLKDIVAQHGADFVPVFGLPQTTTMSALNVDLSTLTAATDVAFGFGQPITEIVDLNFQSGPDHNLAARLLLYNAAFHLRFQVPVGSLAILLRPKADVAGLNGKLAYISSGKRVEFEYDVVRMWQQPVEKFLSGGLGLLPLATLCQLPEPLPDALRKVVRAIGRRLAQEVEHAQAVRLMTAAFILTGMRVAKEDLVSIYRGVRIMQESTAYDMILEEGRAEGLEKGRLEEARRILCLLGEEQFNTPAGPKVQTRIESINSLEELEHLTKNVARAKTWAELLAKKTSAPAPRRKKKE